MDLLVRMMTNKKASKTTFFCYPASIAPILLFLFYIRNGKAEYAKFTTILRRTLGILARHYAVNVWRISNFSLDILSDEIKLLRRTFSKFAGHVWQVRRISRTLTKVYIEELRILATSTSRRGSPS